MEYNRKVWLHLDHIFVNATKINKTVHFTLNTKTSYRNVCACIYYLSFHLIIEAVRRDLQFKQRPFWLFNGIIGYNFDVHSLKMSRPRLVQITSEVLEEIFKLIYDEIGKSILGTYDQPYKFYGKNLNIL